jgi:hypothetical protein
MFRRRGFILMDAGDGRSMSRTQSKDRESTRPVLQNLGRHDFGLQISPCAPRLSSERARTAAAKKTRYSVKCCLSDMVVQSHSGQAIFEQPSIALWQPKRLALGRMQNHPTPTTASATSQTPSIGMLPTMFPQLISFVACIGLYLELQDSLILDWRSMDSFGHPK